MEIFHSISDFSFEGKTIVTIGTFDGVHIGHQKILSRLIKKAKKQGKKSVLLTFFPHPRMVLQKDFRLELINTIDEKASLLKELRGLYTSSCGELETTSDNVCPKHIYN